MIISKPWWKPTIYRVCALLFALLISIGAMLIFPKGNAVWYLGHRPANQEVRLIIPHASWEPIFFSSINSVSRLSGQTDLRKTELAEGDVEVRVWRGFGLESLEGITLRRVGSRWSAIRVKADNYYEPEKVDRKELRPPKSGWDAVWRHLADAGILTLPDGSEVNCSGDGIDGMSFVVETSASNTYRTYKYGNPMLAECNEAKQIIEIYFTLYEEFGIEEFSDQ
jgi:hypothetical protein